ncbi:MAG: DUF3616 domain-containing protein [Acidobacteriota bacterium]
MFTPVLRQPLLSLDTGLDAKTLADLRNNLSALVLAQNHLWIGADEGTRIERMTPSGAHFGEHKRFELRDILKLRAESEIDIEGLDFQDGHLWIAGSHSLKRKKVDKSKSDAENRKRLKDVGQEPNRYTLARIPLTADAEPAKLEGRKRAAKLRMSATGNALMKFLREDEHLAAFCSIPSKENGLDIEGLAVSGSRIYLGLRGPVLRGWAVILQLKWKSKGDGFLEIESFKKHFLELDGLGVRDLLIVDRDLYVLAGPTMALDGPVFIYRWRNALAQTHGVLVPRDKLDVVVTVPFGAGCDHAEGMTLLPGKKLLVCYDSPSKERAPTDRPEQVRLDVFQLE